ncbi:MAG: NAD(P)H-hydrate dehydratase [Lachnospiraceae bacterium]|nr:NAD(P)H-hydrate dehydratase [Lachnospiraceae bacterium]
MKHILNGKEMHNCDETIINNFFVPSLVLMEKASLSVCDFIKKKFSKESYIGIVCGPGNNGGDGIAVSRLLFDEGYQVKIYLCCDKTKFSLDEKKQYEMAVAYGVPFALDLRELQTCDVILDGIFGTGLSRAIDGDYKDIIETLNEFMAYKIAIDIPSGISADDGRVLGVALKCHATVTFAYYKIGHLLYPGKDYCGDVHLYDIGISEKAFDPGKTGALSFEKKDIKFFIPKRENDSHKGCFGKVLVIAGSKNMAGAALFSAKACYLMGAGLVKIYTDEANRGILQSSLPEALICTYESKLDEGYLQEQLNWADVVIMGPGLSTETLQTKIVKFVMEHVSVPMVVDADGLNIISKYKNILKRPHMEIVLTPHLGEMSRMTEQPVSYIKENAISVAEEYSRDNNVVVVLKDATTITAVPFLQSYINMSGNSGMATAGSGDVLSGIIGGLMALGVKGDVAGPLGVYLHGLCGDMASLKKGKASVMASDILEEIPFILKEYVL